MNKCKRLQCLFAVIAGLVFGTKLAVANNIDTNMLSEKNAKTEQFQWGTLITYFSGESYSTTNALSAVAIINPGMEIHPPHEHSEEEYLMVLEGEGTWTIMGTDQAAKAGDMLYASPWDSHGIKNTGSKPLKFVVFKWDAKAVLPMKKP